MDYSIPKIVNTPFKSYPIKPFGKSKTVEYKDKRIECPKCHSYIHATAIYCGNCGALIQPKLIKIKII